MILRFLIIVHVCVAFPFKCPEPAQWSTRARSHCPDSSKYLCLKNDLSNGYSENCTIFDFLQPGRKHVLRGGLDADICSSERYQPWPINFYTNVSTNCIFHKSTCKEKGQVVYDNGNRNTDATCRCDYTNGYDFLVKPRNPCFCVQSEEDCSCYLKTCQDSRYLLSPDYACVRKQQNTSINQCKSIIHGRMNRTVDQNDNEYKVRKENISTTGEFPNVAVLFVISVLLVFVFLFLPCAVFFIVQETPTSTLFSIPLPVLRMSDEKKKEYMDILTTGMEKRYYIKIVILGKERVGKSCLMKRLLKESTKGVESTDGIDIVKQCQVNVRSGQWKFGKGSTPEERIGRVLKKTDEPDNIMSTTDNATDEDLIEVETHNQETSTGQTDVIKKLSQGETEPHVKMMAYDSTSDKGTKRNQNKSSNVITTLPEKIQDTPKRFSNIISGTKARTTLKTESLKTLLKKGDRAKVSKEEYADCLIMDFAGQKEYYTTHQTFLTSGAIYLVVLSLADDETFSEEVDETEKLSFWIDNIHCYTDQKNKTDANYGDVKPPVSHKQDSRQAAKQIRHNPPIIMVCTGDDNNTNKENDSKKKECNKKFKELIATNQRVCHIIGGINYVSNTTSSTKVFDLLRNQISQIAKTMPEWGKDYPARWIHLERTLNKLRKEGNKFLKLSVIIEIAKSSSVEITSEAEVIMFLEIQHQVGNLIFYNDTGLRECVIIDLLWLINAFKCIVCADKFRPFSTTPNSETQNNFRKTGKITLDLLTEMLKTKDSEYCTHLPHLLDVMEKFDMIVRDKENENTIICPSVINKESSSFEKICEDNGIANGTCSRSPWLCLEFEFLPPALYNQLLVLCMSDHNFVRPKLYLEMGLFFIENSNQLDSLFLCKSRKTIALQYWSGSEKIHFTGQTMKHGQFFFQNIAKKINEIFEKYDLNAEFKLNIKCGETKYADTDDRHSLQQIKNNPKGNCSFHRKHTNFDKMFEFWLTDDDQASYAGKDNLSSEILQAQVSRPKKATESEEQTNKEEKTKDDYITGFHSVRLQKNYHNLIQNLSNTESIIDSLISNGVLEPDDRAGINTSGVQAKINRKLMDHIRSKEDYQFFLEALNEDPMNAKLVSDLESCDVKQDDLKLLQADIMSVESKSTKVGTTTKTVNGKTSTTVNVEETFTYSDGGTEVKTREFVVDGTPPTKEHIQAFVNSDDVNENDFYNLSLSSKSHQSKEIMPTKTHQKPPTNTPIKNEQPPGDFAEQALKAHNGLRAKHGVPALTCAADLCAMAQKWADYLHANDLNEPSSDDHNLVTGENIAYRIGSMKDLDYPAKDVTESWYSEIKNYGSYYGKEPPDFGQVPCYGHFTQVVWKDTKEMGIGKAKGNGRIVVVANYRPAGNYIGSYSENVLPPH